MIRPPPKSTLFPYTPLFRSHSVCQREIRLEVFADFGPHERDSPRNSPAASTLDGDDVPSLEYPAIHAERTSVGVYIQRRTSGDRRFAHTPGHHRRMAGHAAQGR